MSKIIFIKLFVIVCQDIIRPSRRPKILYNARKIKYGVLHFEAQNTNINDINGKKSKYMTNWIKK